MTDKRRRPRSDVAGRPKRNPFNARHLARLRGFAVLVALGDQPAALRACERALADGERRHARHGLAHPEGWLRGRVIHHLGGLPQPLARWLAPSDEAHMIERRATLRALGASDAVIGGLSSLSLLDRGLVVAHEVERLPMEEVQAMLGRDAAGARRRVSRALHGYVRGALKLLEEEPWARREPSGELATRIAMAARHYPGGAEERSR
ncbi:MAG TPA: hypothetical protein VH987_00225 [Candidatus Limnocylindria bacterium]|jgi:hypothetical protein